MFPSILPISPPSRINPDCRYAASSLPLKRSCLSPALMMALAAMAAAGLKLVAFPAL